MTCPSMPHSAQASATAFCTVSEQVTGVSSAIVLTSSSRPRRAHTASAVESTSATTASRGSSSVSRMSTSISTWPGTMLLAPGRTLTAPTVPTVLPVALASAAASTANAISAAPRNASRRSPIGVVPAWAAVPVTVRRRSCGAAIALTIARREPRCSSTAPCSMWSSTKRSAYPSGRRASGMRSGSIESPSMASASVIPSRSVRCRATSALRSPTSAREPRHPVEKRGSSAVIAMTSTERPGALPEPRRRSTASIAPSTP